jgi:hypothetical protein
MQLLARASIVVPRPPDEVFDFAVLAESAHAMMRAHFPIPGVDKAQMLDGAAVQAGARREVALSDGSTMIEELLKVDRPTLFRYRWASRLRPPLSLLVRAGETDWFFTPDEPGTHIEWIYRFELTSPLVYLPASLVVWRFGGWMAKALANLRAVMSGAR